LAVGVFDRWLLQVAGGGIQQGFYSLSFKVGALCFLMTGAMTQLIMREFSIAHENKDMVLMAKLFRQHIPLLYGLTAVFVCFICINADRVVLIMGGGDFKGAALTLSIMALYPLCQTYGQLSNAVFYATDQTRLYRNIGVIFMIVGVPVTYFLLAPAKYCGLSGGAVGLAFKTVALAFISVNVSLYFNARLLKLPFWWYVRHQITSVGAFIVVAFMSSWLAGLVCRGQHVLVSFFVSGAVYLLIAGSSIYFFPKLLGLQREDMVSLLNKIASRFNRVNLVN
jgi:O-antigen/teichoic acid export membrane protein